MDWLLYDNGLRHAKVKQLDNFADGHRKDRVCLVASL